MESWEFFVGPHDENLFTYVRLSGHGNQCTWRQILNEIFFKYYPVKNV